MSFTEMNLLVKALLEGDQVRSVAETKRLLEHGFSPAEIVSGGIEAAMTGLDEKCTLEQFNLLEIMLVGRASMEVIKQLYPAGADPPKNRGTIVTASLEGDIHDLGKNILKMILTANGYRVVDCGKNCPVERLIDRVELEQAKAIGISGLITNVIPQVRLVKEKMARRGLQHVRVMAGGAALKQASADSLNVDFVADTAFDSVHYLSGNSAQPETE